MTNYVAAAAQVRRRLAEGGTGTAAGNCDSARYVMRDRGIQDRGGDPEAACGGTVGLTAVKADC
jgi:hypothetical protein